MSRIERAHDEYFGREPLVEMIRAEQRRRDERNTNRRWAALTIAPSLLLAGALCLGRHVPREALRPEYQDRLVCWDGYLTDELVTDVLVLLEADRLAGEFEQSPTTWQPRIPAERARA